MSRQKRSHPQETVQKTLDWKSVPRMPRVRTTDGHLMDWDRDAIVAQLVKETKLSREFYGIDPITEGEAKDVAVEVEKRIKKIGITHLSGPLVRELTNVILLERGHPEWRNIATRVGTPVYDAHQIDVGSGFEANENANLQDNAESLPWDEKILIRYGDEVQIKPIGEIVDSVLERAEKEVGVDRNGRSEVASGDYGVKAFSFNSDFSVSEVPVTQFIRNAPSEIYEIATSYKKSVKVTAGHNFFYLQNGVVCSKPLSELNVGDSILMPRRIQRNRTATYLDGYEILIRSLTLDEMSDLMITGEPLRDLVEENEKLVRDRDRNNETKNYRKCVEKCGLTLDILYEMNYTPTLSELLQLKVVSWHGFEDTPAIPLYYELTPGLGEWLGLLISDGCHSTPNKITFSNTDPSLHARFAELSEELFGIMPRADGNNNTIISKSVIAIKSLFLLEGCRTDKSVPSFLYSAPDECILGFVRGYHAGDGRKQEMRMTTTSRSILDFLRYAFLIFGTIPNLSTSERDNPNWSTAYDVGIGSIEKFYDFATTGNIENYNYECGDLIDSIVDEIGGATGGKESVQLHDYGSTRRGVSLARETIERFVRDARKRLDGSFEYMILKEYGRSPFTPGDLSGLLDISPRAAYEYVKRLCDRGLCEKVEEDTKHEHSVDYTYALTDETFARYDDTSRSLELLSNLINGDVAFCKIKEIKKVGSEVTYDIATDTDTQNFIAGDGFLFVHNTSHKKKADKISKEQYLLLLPPKLADYHLNGDIHIHDLEYFGTRSFCMDWDLRYFFYYGLMPDGSGTKSSVAGPAKKPEVAILHAVKALGSAQTNFAGGQGFYNFLTFLAPYLEGMSYEEIEQLMQMFVYEMTQMMVARGGQLVFSSVQLAPGVPKLWKDKPIVYKGKIWNGDSDQAPLRTYGEFEQEVRLSFKALMNVMLEGDYWGKPFNFPKPEISIEPDFMEEDKEFNKENPNLPTYADLYDLTFELAAKFGAPYFDNQIPEYRGAGEGISCYQCCAYNFSSNSDTDSDFDDKLIFADGKHFSMGAWQVISINCPRAAYRANRDDQALFDELKHLMDIAVKLFKIKRVWMQQIIERGRMPFATQRPKDPITGEYGCQAVDIEGLVYEVGVVGINEMVQYHIGHQMHESKDAWKLAIRAMTEMELYSKQLSEEHGITIALARTPAETTTGRFAVSDILHREYSLCAKEVVKGDIDSALAHIHETRDLPIYYTNGTHVPPGADVSLTERIQLEHVFFPIVDGGNIMHIFLGESMPNPQGLRDFAMHIAKNTQTGYFAFTRDMTICVDCNHLDSGLKDECSNCGSANVEQLSRVTGYLQAVSGWNAAKRQELEDRKRYGGTDMV